jgi:adenylate kinase family enzyme
LQSQEVETHHLHAGLIHAAMKKSEVNKFLIDGFPRALDQAAAFESTVCPSTAMLYLDCPEKVMQVCSPSSCFGLGFAALNVLPCHLNCSQAHRRSWRCKLPDSAKRIHSLIQHTLVQHSLSIKRLGTADSA